MNTLDYIIVLKRFVASQLEAASKQAEVHAHWTSVIDPFLDRLIDNPIPPSDSGFWIEFSDSLLLHRALRNEAAYLEEIVARAEDMEVRPGLDHFKAQLGLPLDSASLPDFWKQFEAKEGLPHFALTLLLLARLKISPAKFAAKGKRLLTTNPDTIFLAILDDQGKGDFSRN